MNYFRIKFIILLWALTHSFTSFAYDFKVNGLCYNKLSDSTVELTWEAIKTSYSGDIAVPSYVNYNGKKYDIVAIGDYAMTIVTSMGCRENRKHYSRS